MQHSAPAQTMTRRPNARTFEGRQRQRIHALKRTLGYSEEEYRTVLYGITGERHASDLYGDRLMNAVKALSEFAVERDRADKPRAEKVETDQERYEREADLLIAMLAGY